MRMIHLALIGTLSAAPALPAAGAQELSHGSSALEQLKTMAGHDGDLPKPPEGRWVLGRGEEERSCVVEERPYTLCEIRALAKHCRFSRDSFSFRFAFMEFSRVEKFSPGFLVNLAKAGLLVRLDYSMANRNTAVYNPVTKTIKVSPAGVAIIHELGHAVDDMLLEDDLLPSFKVLFRSLDGDELLHRHWARGSTAMAAAVMLSASSAEFFEIYKEYVAQVESEGVRMSDHPHELRLPHETYAIAFDLYFRAPYLLTERFPALHAWVKSTVERFTALDDGELMRIRMENPRYRSAGTELERSSRIRESARDKTAPYSDLAGYCASH